MKSRTGKRRFRHELKYIISRAEYGAMRQRLQAVLQRDSNSMEGGYTVRSLYFDDYWMSAYQEKMAGVGSRRKYRIRLYDYEDSVIKLECKEKEESYIHKESASLTRQETDSILAGRYDFLLQREESVCGRFFVECTSGLMRPAVIVDYEREAFVFEQGDVRITFDDHVRSGWMGFALFDRELPVYEALPPGELIMEIKYTEFLPGWIRTVLSPDSAQLTAASKYTLCLDKKREMQR